MEGESVSSSKIRKLLKMGDIRSSNELLTYNYTISGEIVEGYKVGRTLGFPTANIRTWEEYKVMPPLGVYAVLVRIENRIYKGMLYIGKRPTLDLDNEISLEVNIFDFDADLYEQSISVEFIDFIRGDVKFENMNELAQQIKNDKEIVIAILD
jgi:riboflavin kinase/FMN adenylyltransferase